MKYAFVEIGTSDFDTLIQQANDEVGLSVEPLKCYLDNLPEKPNVKKANYAISAKEGSLEMFYIAKETIEKYNLPAWCSGCNSLGKEHPTVLNLLRNIGLDENFFTREEVKVKTPLQLVEEFEIEEVEHLKVDTEGHDYIIINAWLDTTNILPDKITFETNILTPLIETTKLMRRLTLLGYHVVRHADDTVMERRQTELPKGRETMVSFIYDIGSNMERFLNKMPYWSKMGVPSIIFTEPKYCALIPKNCLVIPMLLSEFASYQHLEHAEEAFKNGLMKPVSSEKVFPTYSILTWSKFDAMEFAINLNPFDSDIFVWFDFGLHQFNFSNPTFGNVYYIRRILRDIKDKIRICRLKYHVGGMYADTGAPYAGGFMAGSNEYWKIFIERFRAERENHISLGYAFPEEHIIARIKRDDIFDEYYGYYDGILNNIYSIKINYNWILHSILLPALNDGNFTFAEEVYNKINNEKLTLGEVDNYEEIGRKIKKIIV